MDYISNDLQQLTGEPLRNNLKLSFGVLYQEKLYQTDLEKLQQEQEELQSQKSNWKFQKVLKNPPQWMVIAIILLGFMIGYLTYGALWGSRKRWSYSNLEPLLAGMLAIAFFQAMIERKTIIASFQKIAQKLTARASDKDRTAAKDKTAPVIIAVLVIFVAVRLDSKFFAMLLWWLIYAVCFIGTYRFMGWLECRSIHPEQWKKKTEQHFASKEDELKKESLEKKKQLEVLRGSDLMSFAHAAVPDNFWDTGKLAVLLSLMENGPINTLAEGMAAYQTEKTSADQQKTLEELYWKQALQNEELRQLHILERSASDKVQ